MAPGAAVPPRPAQGSLRDCPTGGAWGCIPGDRTRRAPPSQRPLTGRPRTVVSSACLSRGTAVEETHPRPAPQHPPSCRSELGLRWGSCVFNASRPFFYPERTDSEPQAGNESGENLIMLFCFH